MPYKLGRDGKPLVIFEMTVKDEASRVAQALRNAGFKATAASVKAKIDGKITKTMNALGKAAKEAVQPNVPVDTGELRNRHVELIKATVRNPVVQVVVGTKDHLGRSNVPEQASSLADLLNSMNFQRTLSGGTTQGWIQKSHRDFKKIRSQVIKNG